MFGADPEPVRALAAFLEPGDQFVARRIEAARPTIDPLFAKYGYYAVAIGAMSPIPFSLLCYVAGLYKVPYRIYALLVLMRVPRLLVFYALIRLGWG